MAYLQLIFVLVVAFVGSTSVNGDLYLPGNCPSDIKSVKKADASTLNGVFNEVALTTQDSLDRINSQIKFEPDDSKITCTVQYTNSTNSECERFVSYIEETDTEGVLIAQHMVNGEYVKFNAFNLALDDDLTSFGVFGCRELPEQNSFQGQLTVISKSNKFNGQIKDRATKILDELGISTSYLKEIEHTNDNACGFDE